MAINSTSRINSAVVVFLSLLRFSASSCNFNVKLKQTLLNEGFHRNLTYGIVFSSENEKERWLYKDCIIGVDQSLPAGVYVNPDELGDLKRAHRLNAIPKNRVNVELPTEQSQESSVYVLGKVIDHKVYLWLPVHARYHQAVPGGGTARNEIEAPRLYLRCPDQRLDACSKAMSPAVTFLCNGSSKEKCSWKEIPYTMLTSTVVWHTPVGDTNHYGIVATGTAVVLTIGSLYLLKTIHEYQVTLRRKKL